MVVRVSRADEDGQGLAEYALILAFIAMAVIAALTFFGVNLNLLLESIGTEFGDLI